jgi:hypothetical protein
VKGFLLICLAMLLAARAPAAEFTCAIVTPEVRAASVLAPPTATGVKRILWTRLAFANETNQPASEGEIESGLQTANATLIRVSNTNASLAWTITSVLQLPNDVNFYSTRLADFSTHARNAAAAAGYDWQSFDVQVFGPRQIPGWTSAFAAVSGNWMYCYNPTPGVILHELGHCFGLWHANAWQTRGPDFLTKTSPPFPSNFQNISGTFPVDSNSAIGREGVMFPGESIEYGDPFDIMGNADSNSDFNMVEKLRLGWIPAAHVRTVTNAGTFRLTAQHALRLESLIVGRNPDRFPRQYNIGLNPARAAFICVGPIRMFRGRRFSSTRRRALVSGRREQLSRMRF